MFKVKEGMSSPYPFPSNDEFIHPFVTIAREPGSGGVPIAHAVAKKLGFQCIDEQLIDDVALSTKKRKAIIQAVDERSRSRIEDVVHSLVNPEYIDDVKYITELTKVVLFYAQRGHVVIVGRAANFITPFAKGLHVSITAPYEVRVQRAMDFEGFTRLKAEEVIEFTEAERKKFVKQYFRQNSEKINSYDLTLNTTFFSVDDAAEVIAHAFYQKFSRHNRYISFFKK